MAGKGGATKGAGRKEFKPTAANKAWVKDAVAVGIPQEIIRRRVINPESGEPITRKTLAKHFGDVIDQAIGVYALGLLKPAYQVATDVEHKQFFQMNRFLCITRLAMKETTRQELTGADGMPLEVPGLVVVKGSHASQAGAE